MALHRDDLKEVRQRKFLGRDFDGLRALLLEYARLYYPDRLRDFSEASMGGLILDLASYVGDNMSFYLDHLYGELDPTTAVENKSIERALNRENVPIVGSSPALVVVTVFIEIPAEESYNVVSPMADAIPIVQANSIFTSDGGVTFLLLEDIDYNATNSDGSLKAEVKVGQKTTTGIPLTFIMAASGLCISGEEVTESVSVGATFVPFKKVTLGNANVTQIISVTDGFGNTYYNVESLTHDIVYKNVLNTASDNDLVPDALKIVPAPYRYVANVSLDTRLTTLTFGGGQADTLEDDVIPDPSEFAISYPYTTTFSRIPVNPNSLLQTKTLGVAATDTTYTVSYRYGGGLSHNAAAGTIQTVTTLRMFFPGNPTPGIAGAVRGSTECINRIQASGGEDALTADELKELIPSIKNSQERIVTRPDLLARVYTIPSNFGRVFRASIRSNVRNPLATQLFIVSRNTEEKLITSPDTLKQNLTKYLNPYRMISDAIDILDARIVNMTLKFDVLVDPSLNRSIVLQKILTELQSFFNIKNFHIDQPIVKADVVNIIWKTAGIVSINNVRFENITGIVANRSYSSVTYDLAANTRSGIIFPPGGGIFEVRYPEVDIVGRAVV